MSLQALYEKLLRSVKQEMSRLEGSDNVLNDSVIQPSGELEMKLSLMWRFFCFSYDVFLGRNYVSRVICGRGDSRKQGVQGKASLYDSNE